MRELHRLHRQVHHALVRGRIPVQNDDAIFARLGEHRGQRIRIIGGNGDRVHALADKILDHGYLLGGVRDRRTGKHSIHAQFLAGALNATACGLKIRDADLLGHNDDCVLFLLGKGAERGENQAQSHCQRETLFHENFLLE